MRGGAVHWGLANSAKLGVILKKQNISSFSRNFGVGALGEASLNPLSLDEELVLITKAKNGDSLAKNKLFLSNLRFIIKEVEKYLYQGLDWDELVVEGMFGMETALRKFDVNRRVRFTTFARWDIRNAVMNALNTSGYRIRQSDRNQRNTIKIKKLLSSAQDITSQNSRIQYVADELGFEKIYVENMINGNLVHQSIDAAFDSEDGSDLHSILSNDNAVSPEDEAVNSCLKEQIIRELVKLPELERIILVLYYDLGNTGKGYSFAEIGPKFGRTRQWAFNKFHEAEKHLEERLNGLAA